MENDFFKALVLFDIHVSSTLVADGVFDHDKRGIMYHLGLAVGLGGLEDGIDTEIMSWAGWGSGSSWRDPDWGLGDRMGLALVGAGNGCFE